jgi:hypothetical protein
MSVLNKLTEGIVHRDLAKEGDALLSKWEKTGLLEGLSQDHEKQGMARLLENQAKQLLKEASSMAGGDVEGFASVAFPLVRRVFGGLLANDLVSVQPMSLPSGLIFFLDFTYANTRAGGADSGDSIYGGGVVANQITGGVNLGEEVPGTAATTVLGSGAESSFYGLNNGYTSPTGSILNQTPVVAVAIEASGGFAGGSAAVNTFTAINSLTEGQKKQLRYDPDLLAFSGSSNGTLKVLQADVEVSEAQQAFMNFDNMVAFTLTPSGTTTGITDTSFGITGDEDIHPVRRLTFRPSKDYIRFTFLGSTNAADADITAATADLIFPHADQFSAGNGLGSVKGTTTWGLEGAGNDNADFDGIERDVIPEIDIKVDSIAVTAMTKKLKAKWTPELGQDLNAYHNLDAEVELTSVLSEHIALEIDREIVNDLVRGATAGTYYWARSPGLFVHRTTGLEVGHASAAPDFTGTVSEWYETLIETINDVSAQIHRKTLRGGANFVVCSPEVANILEFTSGFRAAVTADDDKGTIGAVKTGSLSKKWDVYVDPYFPRNVVLVGRKGGSFLESGYVYAPYVPLQVTPTIFGPEDFTPRKGVMTRYAKQMVRADMYGLVIVRGLLGEAGKTTA